MLHSLPVWIHPHYGMSLAIPCPSTYRRVRRKWGNAESDRASSSTRSHRCQLRRCTATVIAQCNCGTVCACPDCPHMGRTHRQGRWFVLETDNFQVCCEQSEAPAKHLARHAEALRNVLCATWLGETSPNEWNPKCQIVLYASRRSYVAAVGRGSELTVGSSLVKTSKGRIASRRIDLLGAGTKFLSAALPHELTHVVLRDQLHIDGRAALG